MMRYLFRDDESFSPDQNFELVRHPWFADGAPVASGAAGTSVGPLPAGHYLLTEITAPDRRRTRYLGVVGKHTVVMQLTVGNFTSDLFDSVFHSRLMPANYYVSTRELNDSTLRGFEQDYGDAIYPHMMPNQLAFLDPAFRQSSANWESLSTGEIVTRLRKLDEWWQARGLAPLHGIATYTPSNSLVEAMKEIGWNVMHSIIPEQNWSDGHWAINHWGMVNQPFYMGGDDFRKPAARGPRNVVAMTMNSYHLYMPHVTHWGDNVLSPSHFLRWNRSVESGDEPRRFTNFLEDYLRAAEFAETPFFLIAGFEFGRTFGVRSMTRHNRRGLEIIAEHAKSQPIVFATGRDVALYYEKYQPRHSDVVFTQRDYLAGTRIMDKPVNSGPSIGMEMGEYKAVFAHQEVLPFYHYDYREPWQFAADDVNAPADHAGDDAGQVRWTRDGDRLKLDVAAPLPRPVPVALWDAELAEPTALRNFTPPVLDDGRRHTVVELPQGFAGTLTLPLRATGEAPKAEFAGLRHPAWRVQEIGQCSYLFIEFPATQPFTLAYPVPEDCRIDSPEAPLGAFKKGEIVTLKFHARSLWYRFHGIGAAALQPTAENCRELDRARAESMQFLEHAREELPRLQQISDEWFAAQLPKDETVLLEIDCYGNKVFGETSRAKAYDRVVRRAPEAAALQAAEYSDGGISLGNHESFWTHPRGLHFVISGLNQMTPGRDGLFHIYLENRTQPGESELHRYDLTILCDGEPLPVELPVWTCPKTREPGSVLHFALPASLLTADQIEFTLKSDQPGVLDDWYRDGGYIATLYRIAITRN